MRCCEPRQLRDRVPLSQGMVLEGSLKDRFRCVVASARGVQNSNSSAACEMLVIRLSFRASSIQSRKFASISNGGLHASKYGSLQ